MPKRQPEYRQHRPHGEFIQGLDAAVGDRESFRAGLVAAVASVVDLQEVPLSEAQEVLGRAHRRVTAVLNLGTTS
jgi:hypothetical protein